MPKNIQNSAKMQSNKNAALEGWVKEQKHFLLHLHLSEVKQETSLLPPLVGIRVSVDGNTPSHTH